MAKLQRWRRSRSAGEGARPVEDTPDPVGAGSDEVEPDEDGVTPETVTTEGDLIDPEEGSEPADETADAAADGNPYATVETDDDDLYEPAEADEEDPTDEDLEVEVGNESAVATAPRTGITGWLFGGRSPRETLVVSLLQAAHLKQAITTALVVGAAAAIAGRAAREVGVIIVTVLVGQVMLGWHNDITDKDRDQRHDVPGKPVADGRLDTEVLWFAMAAATCALIPLSITTGITAGCLYLIAVAVGMLGNLVLRTGVLSWWSWAVSFGLIPFYLSYGGWGGQAVGRPPEPAIVALAALLGIGVHFMRSVWGLVADHAEGWTYLPLKLALKVGATRVLALSTAYTVVIAVLILVVGSQVGLSR